MFVPIELEANEISFIKVKQNLTTENDSDNFEFKKKKTPTSEAQKLII